MKRMLSLLLVFTIVMSTGVFNVNAEHTGTYGDLTYTIENGEVAITDCDESVSGEIVIPDTIEGYPVTAIGNSAFLNCVSLTSITIPDSVTSIGNFAFYRCIHLTSITIPDSVTSIGKYAFRECLSLTSITISDSVTTIGVYAFDNCMSLTSVTIPNSVTTIDESVFFKCGALTKVTIPNSVTTVSFGAFYSCDALTDVYYGGSQDEWESIEIGDYNESLTNATIHYSPAISDTILSSIYTIDRENNYIRAIPLGTTVADFIANLSPSKNISVYRNATVTTALSSTAKVGTGNVVKLTDSSGSVVDTLTVIILGDITGDGKINTTDLTFIKGQIDSSRTLTAIQRIAGNLIQPTRDIINTQDLAFLKGVIYGSRQLVQK